MGLCCRADNAGVTSFVRVLNFRGKAYHRLLHLFHSKGLDLDALTACWVRLCLALFSPFQVGSRIVCLADGIKAPKEGKRMPAVKLLHQQSESNTKPEYIMGHSLQAISLLVNAPVGHLVRFVIVHHPVRGTIFLLCTDLSLAPLEILQLYGYRFKIELGFRQAVHVLGTYAYHFWMAGMKPLRRGEGDQYLHHTSDTYRAAIRRKLRAYHIHVQLGCIAQGLLQHLSLNFTAAVWRHFRSWLRTMNPALPPSERVVANALRTAIPAFFSFPQLDPSLRKITEKYARYDLDSANSLLAA